MKIDKVDPALPIEETKRSLEEKFKRQDTWGMSSISPAQPLDPYNLELKTVLQKSLAKEQTGSVSCPPCNETNNGCYGTQACTPNCSGNANCS